MAAPPPLPCSLWRALVLGAALAGTVSLLPLLLRPDGNAAPADFEPIDLGGLPEIRARHGLLSTTLVASPQTVHLGAAQFPGAAYNGSYGGPVLRVHPGDRVELRLVNHMADSINLHFHGMRITPDAHGDNMHVRVAPGASYLYTFRIPLNHPPGMFWYHDHAPEAAEPHVMAGLSGAFLVEGFDRQFRGLDGTAQKLLVLKDWAAQSCPEGVLKTYYHCHALSMNGQVLWQTSLRVGERQLWRIASHSANLIIHLAAPGLHWQIIGMDGVATIKPRDVDVVDVLPAGRVDVLVWADAHAQPGSITLNATHVPTGSGAGFSTQRPLARIHIEPSDGQAPPAPLYFPQLADLRRARLSATREIVFSENRAATKFMLNGKVFDETRVDLRVPLGSIESWTIRNTTNDFHEFHIHQLGFQLVAVNGVAQDFTGYVDTVLVPEQGSVTVLIPFTDPLMLGHFMYHCHVLKHEDRGMMANIEVYRPGFLHLCSLPPG